MKMEENYVTGDQELDSKIADVLKEVGPKGRKVVVRILEMARRRSNVFFLKPTGRGFHLCIKLNKEDVKLVQVWASLKQDKSQILETRMQWLPTDIWLTRPNLLNINHILTNANFESCDDKLQNYRLDYGEDRKIVFEGNVLDKIEDAIVELASIIKRSAEQT